jgi:thiol-disulfide isomerase/thioredoxin
MGKSYSEKIKSRNAHQKRERIEPKGKSKKNEEQPPFPVFPMTVLGIIIMLIVSGVVLYALDSSQDDSDTGDVNDNNGGNNNDSNGNDDVVTRGEIRLDSTDGSDVYLDKYKGKVIVLDMFATWCNPCRIQMEELDELDSRFSSNELVILSVGADLGETLAQLREFEKEEGATWPFARSTQAFNQEFPASSIPTLYILDTLGNTAHKHVGVTDADTLESDIRPLL